MQKPYLKILEDQDFQQKSEEAWMKLHARLPKVQGSVTLQPMEPNMMPRAAAGSAALTAEAVKAMKPPGSAGYEAKV